MRKKSKLYTYLTTHILTCNRKQLTALIKDRKTKMIGEITLYDRIDR